MALRRFYGYVRFFVLIQRYGIPWKEIALFAVGLTCSEYPPHAYLNRLFWNARTSYSMAYLCKYFPKWNFSAKFFKIRQKSLFSGGGCENSLYVQKAVRAVTVWKSFPLSDFVGGYSKSFLFLSDTSQLPYFVQKNPFIRFFLNKRIFLYRKVRLRCTCFIPDTFRYTPVSDFSPVSRLFRCRSDCSTVPRQFPEKNI